MISVLQQHAGKLPLDHHVFLAPIPLIEKYSTFAGYRHAVQQWNDFLTVGMKPSSRNNRLDYIAMAELLHKIIPALSATPEQPKYYLKPPDLSASNVFIDNDFNITCIIDWTSCSTVPLASLLTTPSFPQSRDDVEESLVQVFRDGFTSYIAQPTLCATTTDALCWDQARLSWLWTQSVNLDGTQNYHYFVELYTIVNPTLDEAAVRKAFNSLRQDPAFVTKATALLVGNDLSIDEVQRQERDYFKYQNPNAEAVARRLTAEMETDENFIFRATDAVVGADLGQ